ncbi:MAG: hypothetical protein FWD98_05925 [Defluviitaleaceae bacterium]|nr:hypothetical protein [Defluviitaleaceae bacterium]
MVNADTVKKLKACANIIQYAVKTHEWEMLERRAASRPAYYGDALLLAAANETDAHMKERIEAELALIYAVIENLGDGADTDSGKLLNLDTRRLKKIVGRLLEFAAELEQEEH